MTVERLIGFAISYAMDYFTTEEVIINHRMTLDELIERIKPYNLQKDIMDRLEAKRPEYLRYKVKFDKAKYLKDKPIINGKPVTRDIVEKVLKYLRENERLRCDIVVRENIEAYMKGELKIDN